MSKKHRFLPKPTIQDAHEAHDEVAELARGVVIDEGAVLAALSGGQESSVTFDTPRDPFLALGTIKIGPSWHVVELDCERFDDGTVQVKDTRLSNAATRARAIAEFKMTAARKKVIA